MSGTPATSISLHDSLAWRALTESAQRLPGRAPTAFPPLRLSHGNLTLDLTYQCVAGRPLDQLVALAQTSRLRTWIDALFRADSPWGPGQPAAHCALRALPDRHPSAPAEVARRAQLYTLARRLRAGEWHGCTGATVTDLIYLGIGGSFNGSRMLVDALPKQPGAVRVHMVCASTPAALLDLLATLRPESTAVVIASKSFTTSETLRCATLVTNWLGALPASRQQIFAHHVLGISAHPERMAALGVPAAGQLVLDAAVCGRFSACSAMAFPAVVSAGPAAFDDLLAGAAAMDEHFRHAPWRQNLPVLAGLMDVWNRSFLHRACRAVLTYDERLASLAPWLEQLEMESCGKSVARDGRPLAGIGTAPLTWAGSGTDAAHSLFQFLRHGTHALACEMVLARTPASHDDPACADQLRAAHRSALEGCQAAVTELACPTTPDGQRLTGAPVALLELAQVDARTLGALVSFCEHRVLVKAAVWNINPFDQPAVDAAKAWHAARPA